MSSMFIGIYSNDLIKIIIQRKGTLQKQCVKFYTRSVTIQPIIKCVEFLQIMCNKIKNCVKF